MKILKAIKMKTKVSLSLLFVLVLVVNGLFAQCGNHDHNGNSANSNHSAKQEKQLTGKQTFKVLGNCSMCKARIENAALGVKGVKTAVWNAETKMLTVDLKSRTDIENVYQAVTKAGHDTEKYKVADKVYNNLPGCCKYRN
jgi:copper chaperone CopZ